MAFGSKAIDFCEKQKIGKIKFHEDGHFFVEFEDKDIHKLKKLNCLLDASHGGLLLGPLHSEGGIHMLKPEKAGKFRQIGEMEGWEYLTGPLRTYDTHDIFNDFNFEKLDDPNDNTTFEIPDNCKLIDVSNMQVPFIILSDKRQFVINRFATRKNIKPIINLDFINHYLNSELDQAYQRFESNFTQNGNL